MSQDPRRRQKAIMKKRSKEKAAAKHRSHQAASLTLSAQSILRNARTFPLYECWINADWQKEDPGLVEVVLSRQQPDGDICFGTYLIDKLCLGLKNTFARTGLSRASYHELVPSGIFQGLKPVTCPIELAHQMIYASIEYAAQFGFEPEKDYALSQYLLAPRGELAESYDLTFGRNGKPFFIAGPRDNAQRIIKQLEKTAGIGNFDYLMPMGNF